MTRNQNSQDVTLQRENCLLRTSITAQVMMEVVRLLGAAARSDSARRVEGLLWSCELRYEPGLRAEVRVAEGSLLDTVRIALRALGFTVVTKRDDQGDYLDVRI